MASELQVNTITEATSGSGITFAKDIIPATPLSHRNLIINGAMQVSQRLANDTLVQVTNASYVSLDRWKTWENTDGTYQVKQKNITDLDGFTSSLYLSPNSADTSIANSYYSLVGTIVEAQNLQHIGVGTANAKTMTLSFYIKSNLTGTMNAYLAKYDNGTMVVPLEFDLPSSAGTWERKTLTVPAVTTGGVINNDSGLGFEVIWALTVGNTYRIGTNGTWGSSGNALSTSNHNVNFMSSTSNYIELTGVQLELGSVATPFEHKSYGEELQRCQRYYWRMPNNKYVLGIIDGNGTYVAAQFHHPVRMRATPTAGLLYKGNFYWNPSGSGQTNAQPNGSTTGFSGGDEHGGLAFVSGSDNLGGLNNDQITGQWLCRWDFSAEL